MEQLERAFAFFDIEYKVRGSYDQEFWPSDKFMIYYARARHHFVAINYNLKENRCMESPSAFAVVAQVYQWMTS